MGKMDQNITNGSFIMTPNATFSPISLRYIAALRGNKAKKTGTSFTYAEVNCREPETLICLAASNPEGRFYGLVPDDAARRTAENISLQRGTFNVVFLVGSASETIARLKNGSSLPPMLDYLCVDESKNALTTEDRAALYELARTRLNANGLFVRSYRAYDKDDGALHFLVREMTPEMNEAQQIEFLSEIKILASAYLVRHPDVAQKLDSAIAKKAPKEFFDLFGQTTMSGTFDMQVAMSTCETLYAGDAHLASNFVELAVPAAAQDLIISCRKNPMYEVIKDLALDRTIRSDIWIKAPVEQSANPAELFGGFAYGLIVPHDQIPTSHAAQGKNFDLSAPLYGKLTSLMDLMPVGIGDVLSHATGKGENPAKILEALQVLVACGFVAPMRGALTATKRDNVSQPRLVGSYNRFIDKTDVTDKDIWFASQVMGCGIALSAKEALVMQALNRAGLNNSVAALMPELRRLAKTSAAQSVMATNEPTPEMAQSMIREVVGQSLPQWYAFALLEAA